MIASLPPLRPLSRLAGDGVTSHAIDLLQSAELVDMHVDSVLGSRLWRYDLLNRNGGGPFDGFLFGQLDFPRALAAGVTGAAWSIVTNPFRRPNGRLTSMRVAIRALRIAISRTRGRMRPVRTFSEYQAARAAGAHAAFVAVQGGNAFDAMQPGDVIREAGELGLSRVTLVHLTNSSLGGTSSPLAFFRKNAPLTGRGVEVIRALDEARVFVDLAHASNRAFWGAMEVHDKTRPIVVSHTGVSGVRPHWRNLDDAQIKAVAETGGVVGVMFQRGFLSRPGGPRDGRMVVEHLKHIVRIGGEDAAALGSDYDGAIVPPPDMRTGDRGYPRLVQHMIDAGMSDELIRKILGGNFLRALNMLAPH